ncbi:phosphoribosylformylglycinamidine cyclo-ligase, partial [bacterium]|nr:phosphoribosylformylglycinamidine cyclo-ligase [bacterium]
LPKGCKAVIRRDSWVMPEIFRILQSGGNMEWTEMYRTFNCGIGMVLAVPEKDVDEILIRLSGLQEKAFIIGEVAKCEAGAEAVEIL